MEIPVETGEILVAEITQVRKRGAGTSTLIGKLRGYDQSDVLIVYHDGVLSGNAVIYDENRHYEFGTLNDGTAVIRELNETAFTAECGTHDEDGTLVRDPQESSEVQSIPPTLPSMEEEPDATMTTMDVVVGYGYQARVAEGGVAAMEAKIIASVDRMNTAFANSGVTNIETVLLGTIEDPDYVYPGGTADDMGTIDELGDLASLNDGYLDTVTDLGTELGADLTTFVIKDADGSAGIAYQPGRYAVIASTYMASTRITFAHELGHNIGCRHAWGDTDCNSSGNNYGWRLKVGGTQYRSVMSYDWGWTRIPWYSNPNVLYSGSKTGATDGYNATGDATTDPRFITTGYSGSCTSGFDGTHPGLGANNAQYIQDNARYVEDNATRTPLAVLAPATDEVLQHGQAYLIRWSGGTYGDSVDLNLYRGGVFETSIASSLSNNEGKTNWWTVPSDVPGSDDYAVRVTLNGTDSADSGVFSIYTAILAMDTTALSPASVLGEDADTDSFDIWNSGSASSNMTYTISSNAAWLSASPVTGSSSGEHDTIQVLYHTAGLATGEYSAAITVTAPNAGDSPANIDVSLTVLPPPPMAQPVPYTQDFSGGLPGSPDGWEFYSDNEGRIRVVSGILQMDDDTSGGATSLNEAVLHLDLLGRTNVLLTFDHIDYGDEDTGLPASFDGHYNADGVSFSADGITWHRLLSLTTAFTAQEFDLDSAVAAAGIGYNSQFRIKFQQYDNYPISTDGRGFDNILLDPGPALSLNPTNLAMSALVAYDPAPSDIAVSNAGGQSFTYSVATNAQWVSVNPVAGSISNEVDSLEVLYATAGLSTGTYNATITISSPEAGGSPVAIPVSLTVFAPVTMDLGAYGSNSVGFAVESQPGWRYILQCRTNLLAGQWINLSTNTGDGTPLSIGYTNELGRAFYQMMILPP
ncbi:MAG: hypothetical protein KJ626_02990 [Verrucomicrobia bacterium]|nr:hypothetical protein [Verrucomicrobiota bacterium]